VATGEEVPNDHWESLAMSGLLFLVVFFSILAAAGALGWTADSRDNGVKSPRDDGRWFASA
jgi:hypothetical protein